jgi:hypothetical protein
MSACDLGGRFRTNQPGTHTLEERGLDSYPTPPIAVESLLATETETLNPQTWIYEPATGNGAIVKVLREHGIPVITSDIVRRDFPLDRVGDFLRLRSAPPGLVLVTNPPYQHAAEFAEHALALGFRDVFLLLRLAFLESVARTDLLEHSGLRAVHVFRRRLPRMHREGWNGNRTSSSMAFAWFCWRLKYQGSAILTRI